VWDEHRLFKPLARRRKKKKKKTKREKGVGSWPVTGFRRKRVGPAHQAAFFFRTCKVLSPVFDQSLRFPWLSYDRCSI
jgi:hypothetical protein